MTERNYMYVEPVYINKLGEAGMINKEIGEVCKISNSLISQSRRDNKVRECYETCAKNYYEKHFIKKFDRSNSEDKQTKSNTSRMNIWDEATILHDSSPQADTVLMVVIKNNNVDFLTRIVRSLRGEITTV